MIIKIIMIIILIIITIKIIMIIISIGNRMNESAFRDIWARVMFFKFQNCTSRRRVQFENLKNITSDHVSRTARSIIRFFIYNILSKIKRKSRKRDRQASMDTQICNGFETLPNCLHVLFQPINYNLVTSKLSLNFQENFMN